MRHTSIKQFIQGNWGQIRPRLQRKYEALDEQDLRHVHGAERELLQRLQVKLDMAENELINELRRVITQ